MTKILHKRNSSVGQIPLISDLDTGELAINTVDGKLYTKKDVLGSFSIVEIGAYPSELEKVQDDLKTGWRLLGADADNYGPIGQDAVDLSFSLDPSITQGATGDNAVAINSHTTAEGNFSFASGYYTTAINDWQTVQGKWNVGTSINTIHETGIGTSAIDLKNAFEIYTDGKLIAPELTLALIDTDRSLTTKEYVDQKVVGDIGVLRFTDLSDTPGLMGEAAVGKWLRVDATGTTLEYVDNIVGAQVLTELNDVDIPGTILDGDHLVYDNGTHLWTNQAPIAVTTANIQDFNIVNVQNGESLEYLDGFWVNTNDINGGTF